MKNIKLKTCPFCGGEAIFHKDYDSMWCIECQKCGLYLDLCNPRLDKKEDLIKYWNTRSEAHDD